MTGGTVAGLTPGRMILDCVESVSATCSVHFTGTLTTTYDNATRVLAVNSPGGQSVFATGSTCTFLPNDTSVTIGATNGGNLNFLVSPATTITVT